MLVARERVTMPEDGPVLVAFSTTGGVGMVKVAVEAGVVVPPCERVRDCPLSISPFALDSLQQLVLTVIIPITDTA